MHLPTHLYRNNRRRTPPPANLVSWNKSLFLERSAADNVYQDCEYQNASCDDPLQILGNGQKLQAVGDDLENQNTKQRTYHGTAAAREGQSAKDDG